jgi:eukaryotic-like serine/threonine-protein kinase
MPVMPPRENRMGPDRRKLIQSVALEAMALGDVERPAYLDASCGSDAALRREVDSLLAGQAQAALFESPPWTKFAAPLAPGTRLGPYAIDAAIGAGGMGEVYTATDTRLGRTVAVKVLPPELAADSARRARFRREANTIAALSHPHICPLFDVGEDDGVTFLVMEHLSGATLAERLMKGRLPIAEALRLAIDMADGLSAAHRQGIVHRDLKPGNVVLTTSGATLLDFGLAKLTRREPAVAGAPISPSAPGFTPLTGPGMIVGTLPYIAPEQLEGREVDVRADVWAFGCVVYEMLTGHRPFEGASEAAQVGAVLHEEPPSVSLLVPGVPPLLDRLVQRCLAKNPDDRWRDAHELLTQLNRLAEPARTTAEARRDSRIWQAGWRAVLVVGSLLAGAALASAWWLLR